MPFGPRAARQGQAEVASTSEREGKRRSLIPKSCGIGFVMPNFKWNCPRCQAISATFNPETLTYHARDQDYYASCNCSICQRPTLFKLRVMPRGTDFTDLLRNIPDLLDPAVAETHANGGLKSIEVMETYPTMLARQVPECVPPNVAEPLLLAHEAYHSSKYEAAAFSVRQAMERAVRYLDPNAVGGLKAKIVALHARGLAPEQIVAHSYKVRIESNWAMQEDPWTEGDARKLIEFAHLFFADVFTLPTQKNPGVFVRSSGRGSRVETEVALRSRDSQTIYPGPAYDGALWLERPRLRSDGGIEASVCWDRRGVEWERIVIGPRGIGLTSAFATGVMALFVTYGQSLGRGSTPLAQAAAYTTSAIDPGNALMFDQSPFFNPLFGDGRTMSGFTDLRHVLEAQYGETHLGSFALRMLESMNVAGAKVPGIYWTKASGGQSLRDLGEDAEGYTPNGKIGGCWQDMIRSLNYAHREVVSAYGMKPAVMPMTFIHGEEDSAWSGISGREYLSGLSRIADLWNADLRRAHGWASSAPDLPIILTQTKRTSPRMYSGSGRIYKRGTDCPRLAQWAAPFHDRRLVLAGPNHHLPGARDGAHLTPEGYFRLGEQIARQFWACTFGTGPLRFNPVAVIRQSATEFDIVFKMPSGSLVLDTTTVTDALDGQKGFVCWDNANNTGVAVSNLAIQSSNSVRVTLSEESRSVELWCDYALWGDGPSHVSQHATGPRGNLRTDTAYVSLLGSYGGPATTDHDWCPAFRIPVPFWGGGPSTWMVDGRL